MSCRNCFNGFLKLFDWRFRRGLGATDRGSFDPSTATNYFLDCDTFIKSLNRIFALQFCQLFWRILVQELIDGEISTADFNCNLISLNLDSDSLRAKLVNTRRFAHKHDLQLLAVWIVVDILR